MVVVGAQYERWWVLVGASCWGGGVGCGGGGGGECLVREVVGSCGTM